MKITVLMAAYEGERYIEQQLDSILAQTVPDIQIMISDDGSGDNTRKILERYERWYPAQIVLKHRVKEGAYQDRPKRVPPMAMNFFWLLGQARGDYVLLCDQDDVWKNHKVKTLLRRMRELEREFGKGHPILVHSDMEVTDEDLYVISRSFFRYQHCNPHRTAFSQILAENPVTGGAVMMNGALARLVGKAPRCCFMHDWWIALTASCFGTISCVREPLYQYRQHGGNTLGARRTGSLEDVRGRLGRGAAVEDNYRRMFAQAAAFGAMHKERMTREQKATLKAFLALPLQPPAGRLGNIVRNGFYKSSPVQTLAQCVTIPELSRKRSRPDEDKLCDC